MLLMKMIREILAFACFCVSVSTHAQGLELTVPESAAVNYGILGNGMSYYICRAPENSRSSIYMIQRTGSLVEKEDEYGLAHFVEHLVFCGTKSYKGRQIIDFIQSIGADFGRDINARTFHEYTYYQFENIPIWNDSIANRCLLMLRDMMYYAELSDEAIENERNVIIEEALLQGEKESWNTSNFPFSRPVIGDTATILHCSNNHIRDFYHRWYQPQMQAVIIVSPSNPEKILEKIQNIFDTVPQGVTTIPKTEETILTEQKAHVTIKHEPYLENNFVIQLLLQLPRPETGKHIVCQDIPYYALPMKIEIPLTALVLRLEHLGWKCHTSYHKHWGSAPMCEFTIYPDKGTPQSVLYSFLSTVKSLILYGFPEEIIKDYIDKDVIPERERGPILWQPSDEVLSEMDYHPSSSASPLSSLPQPIFKKCLENFLYGEPILDSKKEKQISNYIKKNIDAKWVQNFLREMLMTARQIYVIKIPQQANLSNDDIADVIQRVKESQANPITLQVKGKAKAQTGTTNILYNKDLQEIVYDKIIANGTVRELGMPNGIKVLINRSNPSEYGHLYAFREGGYSLISPTQAYLLEIIGRCQDNAHHLVSWRRGISDDFYELDNIYEWEDGLKEFYHELTEIELDSILLDKAWKEEWGLTHSDKLSKLRRKALPSPYVQQVEDSVISSFEMSAMRKLWKKYKSNYHNLVVAIDGVTNERQILPYIRQYIGGLPSKPVTSEIIERDYYISSDSTYIDTTSVQKQNEIVIHMFQEHDLDYTTENVILHQSVKHLLQKAIIDRFRLKRGDIYTASVRSNFWQFTHPHQEYMIALAFSPKKTEKVTADLCEFIHEMAYGNAINQQMVNNIITTLSTSDDNRPSGSNAFQIMNQIMRHGVNIDVASIDLKNIVTIDSIKRFLRELIEKGYYYKYMSVRMDGY